MSCCGDGAALGATRADRATVSAARRPPSTPPEIDGFTPIDRIGSGGFADVFRYRQTYPNREVAVKVLVKERLETSSIEAFAAEANIMAQLSAHPSIVAIHQAGISRDGRPYLVMEYCPRPNLQVRHRKAPLTEAEALRIGVQIAGAVETAHRAGVLHRDIKPANILVTAYDTPKLTDFGIAAVVGGSGASHGLSIPWAAPENLADASRAAVTSDVYSLAATLYTLLADRSPFEVPGGSNSSRDVEARILADPVPPLARADVSSACEEVLRRAMSKNPSERPQTALEFARALQRVQIGLGLAPTRIQIAEDEIDVASDGDFDRTRFREATTQGTSPAPSEAVADTAPRAGAAWATPYPLSPAQTLPDPVFSMVPSPPDPVFSRLPPPTVIAPHVASPVAPHVPKRRGRGLVGVTVVAGIVAVAAIGALWFVIGARSPGVAASPPSASSVASSTYSADTLPTAPPASPVQTPPVQTPSAPTVQPIPAPLSLQGRWHGDVHGDWHEYTVDAEITDANGRLSAVVTYPVQPCAGRWTQTNRSTDTVTVNETMPSDSRCLNNVSLTLTVNADGTLSYSGWSGNAFLTATLVRSG